MRYFALCLLTFLFCALPFADVIFIHALAVNNKEVKSIIIVATIFSMMVILYVIEEKIPDKNE